MNVAEIRRRLRARANPASVAVLQRFFKTGPSEYGEGDIFIGVRAPELRRVCRDCCGAPLGDMIELLHSPVHEERSLALALLVDAFRRGDARAQQQIYRAYLANTAHINGWDLVDGSAEHIVGAWLRDRSRAPLRRLARSSSIWERRIAMLATFHYIKQGDADQALEIAGMLANDEHDLIHKAVGWMLREVEKRADPRKARTFLDRHSAVMPRTMLRYAIERFPEKERLRYLQKKQEKESREGTS